jgi:hypothetical protein
MKDQEEFYATIKLVSGEEIFSKVSAFEEEDKTILMLDSPVSIEMIHIRQIGMSGVKINPWLKLTDDSLIVMNMDKVITMSEVNNQSIIKMYNKFLRDKNRKNNISDVTPNMGYVSSISDARVSLEKLYKLK